MPEEVVEDNLTISAQRPDPDIVLVTIGGDLDIGTVPQATAFLAHAVLLPPRHLILDLSGVTFLSSSGLALLIAAQPDDGTSDGPHLHLLGVTGNRPVERPLALIGMLDRFDIATDLDTLLARLHAAERVAD
jgi:anti-sigma B factor antagonist